MPQKLAGWRTEPPVSEPSAAGTAPAATSAADPPDEPPGTRVGSIGMLHPAERGVFGGGAHGELVEVRLARDHAPPRLGAG